MRQRAAITGKRCTDTAEHKRLCHHRLLTANHILPGRPATAVCNDNDNARTAERDCGQVSRLAITAMGWPNRQRFNEPRMLGLQIPRIRSHQVRCGCPAAQLIAEAQRAAGSARAGRTRPISPAPSFSARTTWLLLGALENVPHNGSSSRPLAIGSTRKRGPGGRWRCVTRRDEPRPSHVGSRVRVVTAVTVSQSGLRRPTPDKACAMGTWT